MRNRHGPFRRAGVLGVLAMGLVLALSAPGLAFAGEVPRPYSATTLLMGFTAANPVAIPIQGANRYLTAVEASKQFASAATVVVATGESFPDALGGAALAGAVDGPLLLSPRATVPAEVIAEIGRLGATKVYVLGSTSAVSAAAFSQLDAAFGTVVRLGGANRYDTAALVAAETIDLLGGGYTGGSFMATGANFPDALAAAPIMFHEGMPLILVKPTGAFSVPAGVTKVKILGSTSVVPASVDAALGSKYDGRLAGGNRYATAATVAAYGVSLGMSWNDVGIATGENFPDALCAGPLVGSKNAVLLLTTTATLANNAASALEAHKADIYEYYLFGGAPALSYNVRAQIADILAGSSPPPAGSHALPDQTCTTAGCHYTDLASIHIHEGCYMCHGTGVTPSDDCIDCHGGAVHNAVTIHEDIISVPVAPAESCTQATCHGTAGAIALHNGCAVCHNSPVSAVKAAIANGNATCESCHAFATVHTGGSAGHAISGEDCFTSTCHGTDVARMHTIDFRGTGNPPPGCIVCHGAGVTPSTNCVACHANLASKHDEAAAHASVQAGMSGDLSAGCVSCHGSDLMAVAPGEHIGCTCHAYAIARGATECVSCHADPIDPAAEHPYHVGVHDTTESMMAANSAGCVSCHGSDLMTVLPAGNPVTGVSEHDGCSCHAYGLVNNQMACEDCHTNPMDPAAAHPYHVGVHTTVEASISGDVSAACTACHGTSITGVGDVSMHVADAHAGCSCHAQDAVTPATTECADCHKESAAPHGFEDGISHTGSGWIAASGHSTTTYGKRGVYEDFSAMPITDSNGAAIDTTTWPFPTVDVFWDGVDPNPVAGAVTGLTKDSIITCEDCHTGLEAYEVAGPHGANVIANAGIDPAFPGSFEESYLWAGPLPSGGTTITSGIARYIPGGANKFQQEELANWALQVYTSATTTIPGPATIVSGNDVICAKCHDLYNDGTGMVGWSNYGHEHHDTAPVQYLALYQRTNGTTYTAAVRAESTDTTLAARSIGREGAGACRDCHVAIPHGWKRPRLIVYYDDPAPYNIGPSVYEGEPVTGTDIGSGQMNGLSSVIGPQNYTSASWLTGLPGSNKWSSSQCNACGHHSGTNLSAGAWE